MKILLTGASGFLGKNFILRAPSTWEIFAVYYHDLSFPAFISDSRKANVVPIRCDLTDPIQITTMFDKYGHEWECCIYLAAKVAIPWSVREPKEDLLINTCSLLNLLSGLHTNRFVFISSGAVYDGLRGKVHAGMRVNPTLPYAISKLASEQYVQCYHERHRTIENFLILRFFGAYGPYEASHKIYTRLVRNFAIERSDTYSIYGDGTNLIDAMYIDDAVDALQKVVIGNYWNDIVDFSAGDVMTIEELVRAVGRILGVDPISIQRQGIAHENIQFWASTERMWEYFKFKPQIKLDDGIRRLKDYLMH
jgi:nucleoside-diphosphate-sugar epimerase